MDELEIIDTNANNICNYSFCGFKNIKQEGYRRKTDWLKQRFSEGMKFKVLHSASEGTDGAIEYIPGKYTWRAVEANGYMVIHCIFIMHRKYKGKGYGTLLLEQCLQDAKKENMHGVAVVTSKSTFMAGKELFLKNGFELVDEAPPYFELLVKKFNNAPSPEFKKDWEERLSQYGTGLTIIRSDQCPAIAKSVKDISETARGLGIEANIIELNNCIEAQNAPSPYGVFSIIYNGKLLVDHAISSTRFTNIMNKVLQ